MGSDMGGHGCRARTTGRTGPRLPPSAHGRPSTMRRPAVIKTSWSLVVAMHSPCKSPCWLACPAPAAAAARRMMYVDAFPSGGRPRRGRGSLPIVLYDLLHGDHSHQYTATTLYQWLFWLFLPTSLPGHGLDIPPRPARCHCLMSSCASSC